MNKFLQSVRSFAADDEGSEVVEYALIIALVSIVLTLALGGAGLGDAFDSLATRVTTCFTSTAGTC
ncbi:MAG TPA: Flp family type IVb pilin [Ramlibacter sp.]